MSAQSSRGYMAARSQELGAVASGCVIAAYPGAIIAAGSV